MTTKEPKFDSAAIAFLYDEIADVYADYYEDYDSAVKKQGADLSKILKDTFKIQPSAKVLDCSCGIGTQAIGLALNGFSVTGCDISPKSIDQARQNASRFKVPAEFKVADMRQLASIYAGKSFDAVISCGNALAHILDQADIESILTGAQSLLAPGGVFMAAMTDHEKDDIRQEHLFYDAHVKRRRDSKTMNFQVWTWIKPGESYICDDYTVIDQGDNVTTRKVSAPFRIWRRAKLFEIATALGYKECHWLLAKDTGHHNPIFCAVK